MKTINEREIQNRLWNHLHKSYDLVVPNFFVGNWEMDVAAVTRAGVLVEYEIKRTLADFRNDFAKTAEVLDAGKWVSVLKHERLASGKSAAARFYFVVPRLLAPDVEELLPPHTGLMSYDPMGQASFLKERTAPLLHHDTVSQVLKERMCKAMYWRYWNLRRDFEKALKRRQNNDKDA